MLLTFKKGNEADMRIAVAFENGQVFQHFGHTECFKIYELEDDKVVSSELFKPDGSGHSAMAGILAGKQVDTVICGGLGDGASQALLNAGIEVVSGVKGDADEAVTAYINGELISEGVNCDHHDHHHDEAEGEEDGEGCGSGCGGCGGGCGGCGGGCGGYQPDFDGPNVGSTCRVHYRGTFNDGSQFDSSYDRGEPLEFVCGAGMMIKGFDKAVAGMEIGQVVDIHLMPEEAYGEKDPRAVVTMEISAMPGCEQYNEGDRIYLQNAYGQTFPALIAAKDEKNITFDMNHEMAGKELNFRIELVEVV